jgi:hypothetical protein
MKLTLLAALVFTACEALPPPTPLPVPPPSPTASAKPVAAAQTTKPKEAVQLTVTETKGMDPAAVGKIYGAATESLGHCHQPGGGTVHVTVVKTGTTLHLHVEPGATLDPRAHDCVLEALSTVDLTETGGNVGGPAVPPSGFTSLLTLSW